MNQWPEWNGQMDQSMKYMDEYTHIHLVLK